MADAINAGHLRRKRRRINRELIEDDVHKDAVLDAKDFQLQEVHHNETTYDFLHLVSLVVEADIPVIFPGDERPRNTRSMIASGGSFLVFKEHRTMDQAILRPEEIWSLSDNVVLKRTRAYPVYAQSKAKTDSLRYASIMSEIQLFIQQGVREHWNIIDFHGITWDIETTDEEGSSTIWPVIALEAAESTFEAFITDTPDDPLPKIKYCHDITKALKFLHDHGVAHCDIKAENILICLDTNAKSASGSTVAKLSDFGAAILGVSSDTILQHGIAGTRPWNAPEWRSILYGLEVLSADIYSVAMLLWRALSPSSSLLVGLRGNSDCYESTIKSLEEQKLSDSIAIAAQADLSEIQDQDVKRSLSEIFQNSLLLSSKLRWDIKRIEVMLSKIVLSILCDDVESGEEQTRAVMDKSMEMDTDHDQEEGEGEEEGGGEEEHSKIEQLSLEPFGNDFERCYERFEDESQLFKTQLIQTLKAWTLKSADFALDAAEAAYQLSLCYINGFGVKPSIREGFAWSTKAAASGNLKSKGDVFRLSKLCSIQDTKKTIPQKAIIWLAEAAEKGSAQALKDLELLDAEAYDSSKRSWRQRFCLLEQDLTSFIPSEEWLMTTIRDMSLDELNSMALNTRGHTILHVAASLGFKTVVDEIIPKGANINVLNNYGENSLLCACRSGHVGVANKLLRHGSEIVASLSGETPLHWLISCENSMASNLCPVLVQYGADLEAVHFATENNKYNFDVYPHGTPLDWAVSQRNIGAIQALVDSGADPFNEASEYSPFVRAVSIHDVPVLKLLLASKHATVKRVTGFDSTGQTLLFHAIYCNTLYPRLILHGDDTYKAFIDTVQLLIDRGCDPENITKDGDSVLHLAAGFCDADYIKLLLDNFPQLRRSINKLCGPRERTPLHQAVSSRKIDVVRLLISNGADRDVRSCGATLLHLLAGIVDEKYALECLKELNVAERTDINALEQRADVEIGVTAFEMALFSGHLAVADFLLSNGADPHYAPTRDPSFFSVLIGEAAWHSPAALEFYIEKVKPDFIVRKVDGITAFHIAASMGSLVVDTTTAGIKLDLLLKTYPSKAQIDSRTTKVAGSEVIAGQTPLHYAAKFGIYFAAQKLLEFGADVFAKDEEGHTPLDLIRQQVKAVHELLPPVHSRPVKDMVDTLKMLESAATGRPLENRVDGPSKVEGTRTRFSKLGFQDAD